MISIKYNTRKESGKPSTYARLGDVPDGGGLHDVPDDELLDGLVLGAGLGAVGAPHELDMAAAVLVASIVSTLRCHADSEILKTNLVEITGSILSRHKTTTGNCCVRIR